MNKEQLLKERADFIYVSSSEKYLVLICSTIVKVYNFSTKQLQKIPISNITRILITKGDEYLLCVKDCSADIYAFDINNGVLLFRKKIYKNSRITLLAQCDEENILIGTETKEYNSKSTYNYTISKFNLANRGIEKIVFSKLNNVDIYNLVGTNQQNLFKFTFLYNDSQKGDKYISKYYYWKYNAFDKYNILEKYCNNNTDIVLSKDEKYYAVIINEEKIDNDLLLDDKKSKIIIYDKSDKEIMLLGNRKFLSPMEVLINQYRGMFTVDQTDQNVFYTSNNGRIDLYFLNENRHRVFEFGKPIFNCFISFEKDYVLILSADGRVNYCYIYKLSTYLLT